VPERSSGTRPRRAHGACAEGAGATPQAAHAPSLPQRRQRQHQRIVVQPRGDPSSIARTDESAPAEQYHGAYWRIVPACPTAQPCEEEEPHTPRRPIAVPLGLAVQVLPFQWRMVPASPTTQILAVPVPQIP